MDSPPLSDRLTASEQDESYSALLEEIQELQTKLHRSTSMVEKMSRDSEQFRCQYEQSQVELEQSRKKLRESKDALCNQVKITCMREKEIGILESRWKKTVGAERQDIVSARGELEIMANVRENVEKEFECQLDKLKEVLEQNKEEKHQIIKEFQTYKVKHDILLSNALRDEEIANEGREKDAKIVGSLVDKLSSDVASKDKELRCIKSSLKEYDMRAKQLQQVGKDLRDEIKIMLDEKCRNSAERIEMESSTALKMKEIMTCLAVKDAKLHRANTEMKSLRENMENQKVVIKETNDEQRKVKELLIRYKKEADEKQASIDLLKDELVQEKDRSEKRLELVQKTMKHDMKILSDKNDELLVRLDEKETQLSQIKCDGMSLEEKMKTQYHSELNKLTIENMKLIKVSQQLKNELEATKAEKEYAVGTLKGALEVLQKQLNEVSNENKMLSAKNSSQEEMISEIKNELREVQRGLETMTNDLHVKELDLAESENKNKDLSIQNELLTSRLDERTEEVLAERRDKEKLDKLYHDSEKKNQALLQKEKMKSNAYKLKALEAHAKTMQAKQLLREIPR